MAGLRNLLITEIVCPRQQSLSQKELHKDLAHTISDKWKIMNGWTDRQVDFEQINTNTIKISPSPHSSLNKVENSNRFFTCDISSKFCQLLSHPQIEFYALFLSQPLYLYLNLIICLMATIYHSHLTDLAVVIWIDGWTYINLKGL